MIPLIEYKRNRFHGRLRDTGLLTISHGMASNADRGSRSSKEIGEGLARILEAPEVEKLQGQTAGSVFEREVAEFVCRTFRELQHLRPGTWNVESLGNRGHRTAESFAQYEHLSHLAEALKRDPC